MGPNLKKKKKIGYFILTNIAKVTMNILKSAVRDFISHWFVDLRICELVLMWSSSDGEVLVLCVCERDLLPCISLRNEDFVQLWQCFLIFISHFLDEGNF